jgi:iron(III) transport system ATP-binding protein
MSDQRGAVDRPPDSTADPGASSVRCQQLSVELGGRRVVHALDLEVDATETVALLGPSGSGKTTILSAVAGFLPPSDGRIWLAGRLVADRRHSEPPEARRVGVVFQHLALWPHLSALEIVAYPMLREGVAPAQARRQARSILERLGLGDFADRRPAELSGGEQQRVGLARALARRADVYLFDEPTAHLDTALRGAIQEALLDRRRETRGAAIYATHDVGEAFAVADRVALLRDGHLVQHGPPEVVYERPVDVWAARLTGPAAILELPYRRTADGGCVVSIEGVDLPVRCDAPQQINDSDVASFLVRPEWATLGGPLRAAVEEVRYQGSYTDHRIRLGPWTLDVRAAGPPHVRPGQETTWRLERAYPVQPAGD